MFTIGADPEFFLKQDHKHISAIGRIGGTKLFPKPMPKRGFAMQEDNVSVEFNIPACQDSMSLIKSIRYAMNTIKKVVPGFEVSTESAVVFDADQLQDPAALEFGCEPDYNAWTKQMNPRPCAVDQNLRSAGGHVHVGTRENPIEVIRAMDLFLGVPSTVKDPGVLRRQLYGKAGAFRQKDYGCEYRTLSNFWIFSPELIEWVYNQTEKAINFVEEGNVIDEKTGILIQECINNSNGGAYEHLVQTYGLA